MNTVFVIGAGASEEANLPIGRDLKNSIAKMLSKNHNSGIDKVIMYSVREYLRNKGRSYPHDKFQEFKNEALNISRALPLETSIDNYLNNHRENEKINLLVKLSITKTILEAERKSQLYVDENTSNPKLEFSHLDNTWYLRFFQLLTENGDVYKLHKRFEKMTLIVFNYDRCIEHFLYHALQVYYHEIKHQDAIDLISKLNILHPYGLVGKLPWQLGDVNKIGFGNENFHDRLLELSKNIKTLFEGYDPTSGEIKIIKRAMCEANIIAFIGFGFHRFNLDLLNPNTRDNNNKCKKPICFLTTYGFSNSNEEVIRRQVNDLYKKKTSPNLEIKTLKNKCHEFFNEYWKSLSFKD